MNGIRRILVATGESDTAGHATLRAAMLGVELRADMLELMALRDTRMGLATPATSVRSTRPDLSALAAFAAQGRPAWPSAAGLAQRACMSMLREGGRACAIAERARQIGADLTVIGMPAGARIAGLFGRQGMDDTALLSERPLLVVRARPRASYARVLIATDFSRHACAAAHLALQIAPAAHLTVLHACHVADERAGGAGMGAERIDQRRIRACEQARATLGRFVAALGPRKQLVARSVHYGLPLAVICAHARRLRPDLIVVGKRGLGERAGAGLGTVAARLLGQAPCDLLLAAAPDGDGWRERTAA